MAVQFLVIFIALCLQLPLSTSDNRVYKHPHEINIEDFYDDEIEMVKLNTDKKGLNDDALIYYRRLVKQIFKKQRFKNDPRAEDGYIGMIELKLSKTQYELLVNSDISASLNLNEVDGLVEEVFKQSAKDGENGGYSVSEILYEHYRQELIQKISTLIPAILWISASVLAIYVAFKIFHFGRLTLSAVIFIAVILVCGLSLAITYHECMSDLEMEQMIQMAKDQSPNNPCSNYHKEHDTLWGSFTSFFGSAEEKCHEHMKKSHKVSNKRCDPVVVFGTWMAKIQMSYFGSMFGEYLQLITSITSSSSILTKIIAWIFSIAFFGLMFIVLGKVVVKHTFQGFFGLLTTSSSRSYKTTSDRKSTFESLHAKMDALLLENEHMKRELSVIRECSVERTIQPPSIKAPYLEDIKESDSPD